MKRSKQITALLLAFIFVLYLPTGGTARVFAAEDVFIAAGAEYDGYVSGAASENDRGAVLTAADPSGDLPADNIDRITLSDSDIGEEEILN